MRAGNGGMDYIEGLLKRMAGRHNIHLEFYGDNSKRLTGEHETSKKEVFSYGVGNRAASCRIPTSTAADKKGYVEDRRPASDMNPYVVAALIADTTLLEDSKADGLIAHFRTWKEWRLNAHIEE